MQSPSKFRIAILSGVCGLWLFLGSATAQNEAHSQSSVRAISAAGSSKGENDSSESREAGSQDEQKEFKQSSSVRLVARITGLNLDHAYWLCVLLNFAM